MWIHVVWLYSVRQTTAAEARTLLPSLNPKKRKTKRNRKKNFGVNKTGKNEMVRGKGKKKHPDRTHETLFFLSVCCAFTKPFDNDASMLSRVCAFSCSPFLPSFQQRLVLPPSPFCFLSSHVFCPHSCVSVCFSQGSIWLLSISLFSVVSQRRRRCLTSSFSLFPFFCLFRFSVSFFISLCRCTV